MSHEQWSKTREAGIARGWDGRSIVKTHGYCQGSCFATVFAARYCTNASGPNSWKPTSNLTTPQILSTTALHLTSTGALRGCNKIRDHGASRVRPANQWLCNLWVLGEIHPLVSLAASLPGVQCKIRENGALLLDYPPEAPRGFIHTRTRQAFRNGHVLCSLQACRHRHKTLSCDTSLTSSALWRGRQGSLSSGIRICIQRVVRSMHWLGS